MTTPDEARKIAGQLADDRIVPYPLREIIHEARGTLRSLADQLDAVKNEAAQRVGIAESEATAAQRRRAEKAERELAEIKAQAAVLRDALGGINAYLPCRPCPESPDCEVKLAQTCRRRAAALATGAGKELLAEVEKLRAFVVAFGSKP